MTFSTDDVKVGVSVVVMNSGNMNAVGKVFSIDEKKKVAHIQCVTESGEVRRFKRKYKDLALQESLF